MSYPSKNWFKHTKKFLQMNVVMVKAINFVIRKFSETWILSFKFWLK
jgi:hypothetical protein